MVVIYSTFPSREKAMEIGKRLLEDRLIACFNVFPIESGYIWEDKIVEDREFGVLFKTRKELVDELIDRIVELHPYEVPAVFAIEPISVFKVYDEWIDRVTR